MTHTITYTTVPATIDALVRETFANYNRGQIAEAVVRYAILGELTGADNVPAHRAGDVLNYQVKSARATVCNGTDLAAYLAMDAATEYIFVAPDNSGYWTMDKATWQVFCETFAKPSRGSSKNGGKVNLRLPSFTKKVQSWLEAHTA